MFPSFVDVLRILILILPGFIAYRFVLLRRVDPTQRSSLWQVTEILEHSAFVHLLGVALSFVAVWFLETIFGITTHAPELFQNRPNDFLEKYFTEGVLWFTLYPAYVIIASSIIGAYDTPRWISSKIVETLSSIAEWISTRHKFLHWFPVPREAFPLEPMWYSAFNLKPDDLQGIPSETDEHSPNPPFVIVIMKSGGVYVGEVAAVPIVSDTQPAKDFLIRRASYYGDGDIYKEDEEIESLDIEIDVVLLNTSNVDSIRLYYDEPVT